MGLQMNITAQSGTDTAPPTDSYLILQGLGSPFFRKLAHLLASDGSPVHKVNFCGGDWWFSGGAKNHRFNGKPDELASFYRELIKKYQVTTILLFGDCRPIHTTARAVARDMGLQVWVFEEGYIRPGFITCEKGGTNDLSNLPRTNDGIKTRASAISGATPNTGDTDINFMPARVRMDLTYHLWNILLKPFHFRYRSHRPDSMTAEGKGWISRLVRKIRFRQLNQALLRRYENPDKKFFMVPLQLASDFQIREHSDYDTILEFIREVIASFALHAPKSALLMFKSHPLDNGIIDYRSYIAMAAMNHGIEGRVDYLEGGDLNLFLSHTEGLVLINSTVGYAALTKGRPLKVLGRALYDIQGLTDQKPLDKFWKNPEAPDTAMIRDFLKVIHADSQIEGNLFADPGVEMAAQQAAARIKSSTAKLVNKLHNPATITAAQ